MSSWHPPRTVPIWLLTLAACGEEQVTPATGPRTAGDASGRPNIVVIMTDDQTVESMRVMTRTRELIGTAGITFSNSVATYALCCPSRATFLTGQYPHNHGVRSNEAPDGGQARLDESNTLPVWLQRAGYVTGHVGKYLNGYGLPDTLDVPPGWTEWTASVGDSANSYYGYRLNVNGTVVRYGSTAADYLSDVYTDKAVDFIRRRGPGAGTTPFFLYVGYLAPHSGVPAEAGDPNVPSPVPAPRHKGRLAGETLPPSPAFNEADMSDKPTSMRSRKAFGSARAADIREAHRQRLETLLAVDEGVARIVAALRDVGLLTTTLILFTSDNGYFQGEHRIPSGKILPYEPAVKVPLLASGAGVVPGRQITAAVANVDLAPTIVEVAGATAGLTMDGRSLQPFLSGAQTAWPSGAGARHVLVEDSQRGAAATVFWSIRRGRYVYTEYVNGDRELYDLQTDTAQLGSKHAATGYATVRGQLARRLAAMKTCSGPTACW